MVEIQDGSYTYRAIKTYNGHPNIWWHPNIQGVHPNIQGVSKHKGGIQTYGWCPNIWGYQNIHGASKHYSRLKSVASSATNMGATKHTGGIQTCRVHPHIWGIQMYWGIWTPPWCDIAYFLCVVYVHGHPNITQTYSRVFKYMGAFKHMWGVQTWGALKHTGGIQMNGDIWTLP